jgi:sarcosine oxidase gamma subunit
MLGDRLDAQSVQSTPISDRMSACVPGTQVYFASQGAGVHMSVWGLVRKLRTSVVIVVAIGLASCSSRHDQTEAVPDQPQAVKAEKPFAGAGSIEMHLESGDYVVRAAPDEHIRVSFGGNTGNAAAELATNGTHANLTIRDTPHNNFRVTVEVPQAADLAVHLTGGNLQIAAITGNKEIDSKAGNVEITIPNANDYGSVDASVTVGNLNGGPFGDSSSGLAPHLKWSGPGKYGLRANLGAGNLELKH